MQSATLLRANSQKTAGEVAVAIGLMALTFACFWPALGHEFLHFDDDQYITDNPVVKNGLTVAGVKWAFTTFLSSNWYPLMWLSHMLDVTVFGLNPAGHHFTNILLHALNAVLIFLALRAMTGSFWRAAAVAAIFAVHPLRVESVAWIAERKDVLSAFFGLITIMLYGRYVRQPSMVRMALVAAGLTLGLLSKPMLVTLPCVLLLLDYWPLRRITMENWRSRAWPLIREKLPLFALSAFGSIITSIAQQQTGAMRPLDTVSLARRIVNAIVAYGNYLLDSIWPSGLSILYPYPASHPPLPVALSAAALLVITAIVVRLIRLRPAMIVGWLWFVGMLVPVIGLVQVGEQARADRYTYFPHIGLIVMVVWAVPAAIISTAALRVFTAAVCSALMVALCISTRTYLAYWHDSIALFGRAMDATEPNATAHIIRGKAFAQRGEAERSAEEFRSAIALEPDDPWALNNLGDWLMTQGDVRGAIDYFQRAIARHPKAPLLHFNLGVALAADQQIEQAMDAYRRAIELKDNLDIVHSNLGLLHLQRGELDQALTHLRRAAEINPDRAENHYNLAAALLRAQLHDEAIERYQTTLQLRPDLVQAHLELGNLMAGRGRWTAAADHYRAFLTQFPQHPQANHNLGVALRQLGDVNGAIRQYELALQLLPDYIDALINLSDAHASMSQFERAIELLKKALELQPQSASIRGRLGLVQARAGHTKDAIENLQHALELNPNLTDVRQELSRLRGNNSN